MEKQARIIVGTKYSRISTDLDPATYLALDDALSYYKLGHEHVPSFKEHVWDGKAHMLEDGNLFLTGLLSIVRQVLSSRDYGYEIIDRRHVPEENFPELKFAAPADFDYEERPYQQFTINKCKKFTRGLMQIATGGGKTIVTTGLIAALKVRPFVYFVLSKELMRQAHDTLSAFLNTEIGMVGDGKCEIHDITVCTVQTVVRCLHKDDEAFNEKDYKFDNEDIWDEDNFFVESNAEKIRHLVATCKGFYFDEVHHAAAKTCQEVIFAAEEAYYKFGGTATPYRDDGEDMVVQGLFGGKAVQISATYLTNNDWLVPAEAFYCDVDSNADGHTSYRSIYSHAVVNNVEFSSAIADLVDFLVSNGILCLILVQQIKHGKNISQMIKGSVFLSGKDTTKKRTKAIADMREGKLKVLVATTLADEGLDIKPLGAVFMLSGGASVTRVPQRVGRCIRKYENKKFGLFFYFRHRVKYLFEQGLKVKKILKEEESNHIHHIRKFEDLKQAVCDFINRQQDGF